MPSIYDLIHARAEVVVSSDPALAIEETSRHAAITFLGFEAPKKGNEVGWYEGMENFAGNLPRVLLVNSIGGMSLES